MSEDGFVTTVEQSVAYRAFSENEECRRRWPGAVEWMEEYILMAYAQAENRQRDLSRKIREGRERAKARKATLAEEAKCQ